MSRRQTPKKARIPAYRLHRATGKAVVTLSGRDVYLGPFGSEESHQAYEAKIAEWLAAGRCERTPPGESITVAEFLVQFMHHARNYYVHDGRPTSHFRHFEMCCRHMMRLYSATPVREFGPLALKAVRERMVAAGWARRYVNGSVSRIKQMFKWGVAEEIVPTEVLTALQAVTGLRRGRTTAHDMPPVGPAPETAIDAVRAAAPATIRALIDFQLATGCRPGEAVLLRLGDVRLDGLVSQHGIEIELGEGVWVFTPAQHKTQHHGHERLILMGPAAQSAIAALVRRPASRYCFSPRDVMAQHLRDLRSKRQTGVQPSQVKRAELRRARANLRRRPPGPRYSVASYARCISRLCERLGVQHWTPHQLRHNAATRLTREFGWEVARVLLGHRDVSVTRIYVADDLKRAAEAAKRSG